MRTHAGLEGEGGNTHTYGVHTHGKKWEGMGGGGGGGRLPLFEVVAAVATAAVVTNMVEASEGVSSFLLPTQVGRRPSPLLSPALCPCLRCVPPLGVHCVCRGECVC